MDVPELKWNAAEVRDGVLTVEIDGELPKGWEDKFDQTVTLLGGGQWDEIRCESGSVRVSGVTDGSEESLHHFLEGVVQEANAAFELSEEDEPGDSEEDAGKQDSGGKDADETDKRMTERFRDMGA